ncbi:hypothetical protein HK102_004466 [Quaeritorhiza haematococci]|nr:hypothetical protein HK102_004466 [Quaeritorhiza haematococci]
MTHTFSQIKSYESKSIFKLRRLDDLIPKPGHNETFNRQDHFLVLCCKCTKIVATTTKVATPSSFTLSAHYFPSSFASIDLPRKPTMTIKHIDTPSPSTSYEARMVLVSDVVAPFVWLETEDASQQQQQQQLCKGRFTRNGFLMLPGEEVEVVFRGWGVVNLERFRRAVRVRSLWDAQVGFEEPSFKPEDYSFNSQATRKLDMEEERKKTN